MNPADCGVLRYKKSLHTPINRSLEGVFIIIVILTGFINHILRCNLPDTDERAPVRMALPHHFSGSLPGEVRFCRTAGIGSNLRASHPEYRHCRTGNFPYMKSVQEPYFPVRNFRHCQSRNYCVPCFFLKRNSGIFFKMISVFFPDRLLKKKPDPPKIEGKISVRIVRKNLSRPNPPIPPLFLPYM